MCSGAATISLFICTLGACPAHTPSHRPSPCARAPRPWPRARAGHRDSARGHQPPPQQPMATAAALSPARHRHRPCPHARPAAASYLLGIPHPEGDGVEVDEAASQGLKGRGKVCPGCPVTLAVPRGCSSPRLGGQRLRHCGYGSCRCSSCKCNSYKHDSYKHSAYKCS